MVVLDEQIDHRIVLQRWGMLAELVLERESVPTPAELNVTFVDRATMTELNRTHMHGDGPTDVLSFPLDDDPELVFEGQHRLLGDVVICPDVVVDQAGRRSDAADLDDPVDAELALMVVHGVLHILGHDHAEPDEARLMRAAELAHLAAWAEAQR